MKSKKIVAMFVALLTFMAVATSGLAAVTTKTTYQTGTNKVSVVVDVTGATSSSEVTYLVKNSDGQPVYIDQATADENGAVNFTYKIDKSKLPGLKTTVSMGTNGTNKISTSGRSITFGTVSLTVDEGADVIFYADKDLQNRIEDVANYIIGSEESVFAEIKPLDNYEIATVSGTDEVVVPAGMTIELKAGAKVTVTTKLTFAEPTILDFAGTVGEDVFADQYGEIKSEGAAGEFDDGTPYYAVTKIFKAAGTFKEVGVRYVSDTSKTFPALDTNLDIATDFDDAKLYAVRVLFESEATAEELEAYSVKAE